MVARADEAPQPAGHQGFLGEWDRPTPQEGRMYTQRAGKLSLAELEKKLAAPSSASEMRTLYAQAYREIQILRRQKGEAFVWKQALNP